MVLLGRVFCNFCESMIGQLYGCPAEFPDGVHDLGVAPHFALCPDCHDSAYLDVDNLAPPRIGDLDYFRP